MTDDTTTASLRSDACATAWTREQIDAWVNGEDLRPGPDVPALLIERAEIVRLWPEALNYDAFCRATLCWAGGVPWDRLNANADEIRKGLHDRAAALWSRSLSAERDDEKGIDHD